MLQPTGSIVRTVVESEIMVSVCDCRHYLVVKKDFKSERRVLSRVELSKLVKVSLIRGFEPVERIVVVGYVGCSLADQRHGR